MDAQARIINRIADFLVSIISSLHHLQIIPKSHYGDSFLTHHQKLPVYLFAAQCGIETGSRILLAPRSPCCDILLLSLFGRSALPKLCRCRDDDVLSGYKWLQAHSRIYPQSGFAVFIAAFLSPAAKRLLYHPQLPQKPVNPLPGFFASSAYSFPGSGRRSFGQA